MASTLRRQLDAVQPQMIKADIEPDRKHLAALSETDRKRLVARTVERALEIAGVSKHDASYQMGYTDQGTVSRWCAAVERPLFDKLFIVEGFVEAFVVAIAEQHPGISAETVVRIRRRA